MSRKDKSKPAVEWRRTPQNPYVEARWDAMVEYHTLRELGLLDPEQPTRYGHLIEKERIYHLGDEFTREERREIREYLGLGDHR